MIENEILAKVCDVVLAVEYYYSVREEEEDIETIVVGAFRRSEAGSISRKCVVEISGGATIYYIYTFINFTP